MNAQTATEGTQGQETGLTNKDIAQRKNWYSKIFVAMEICKCMKGREGAILNSEYNLKDNIRYLNIAAVDFLWKTLGIATRDDIANNKPTSNPYSFFSPHKNYNLYFSLAKIDWSKCSVKAFSYDGKKRSIQQKHFKEQSDNYFFDFDCFLDFDGDIDVENISQKGAVNRALRDLRKAQLFLDSYKIQYGVVFSGKRGFHISFPINLPLSFNQKLDLSNLIIKEMKDTLNLETLDSAKLNKRKVRKVPYGLVTHAHVTRVCLPLNEEEINSFNLEDMEVQQVLKRVKLKNRGVFVWNDNLNKSGSVSNFMGMINDLEIEMPKELDRRSI